jgi:membrane-bound lytic murein transglycosylase B
MKHWRSPAVLALCIFAMHTDQALAHSQKHVHKTKAVHPASHYEKRPEVLTFVDSLVADEHFERRALMRLFAQVQEQPSALRAMTQPISQPPKWYEYAPRLVNDERAAQGARFWRNNEAALAQAEKDFGVPPEIVVAIIGVETFYGRVAGNYRVIDALTTLAFDYPRRAEFFRKELREFLLLCREQKLSPLGPKGSYAGAMGLPQFMPATFRNYAIDYNQDGTVDIWRDTGDTIGSVANFLQWHGWKPGGAVMTPARLERTDVLELVDGGLTPRRSLADWRADGVAPPEGATGIADDSTAALILLEEASGDTWWLGFENFYVLTRYNRSRLYASAVWNLAQRIAELHREGLSATGTR